MKAAYETMKISQSNRGRQLRGAVTIQIPTSLTKAEQAITEFVIEGLKWKMPKLIPFALSNDAIMKMARYLYTETSESPHTLSKYTYCLHRYCSRIGKTPDELIDECKDDDDIPNQKVISQHTKMLSDYLIELKSQKLANSTLAAYITPIKTFYRTNDIKLNVATRFSTKVTYPDRAPRPEELQHLINIGSIRSKVVVSCLALGGFRIGTLSQLRYRHIRYDLEKDIVPIGIHVEAEITKGRYHDYDTFLAKEAVDFIKAYLEVRRQGTYRGYFQPEEIHDESPLIRNEHCASQIKSLSTQQIYDIVHSLYYKAGLLREKNGRLYRVRVHSIRKFFRTQLAALGVERDYIDYMMGHTVSTYHDIQMKGIEFLRNIYITSGLSIRPKTQLSKIDALKQICVAWGLKPNEILTKQALAQPHRTVIRQHENEQLATLSKALKEIMRKELLDAR